MWQDLLKAISLVLVIEGMLPFIKPSAWRRTMGRMIEQNDNALRLIGLACMLMGVALLYTLRE